MGIFELIYALGGILIAAVAGVLMLLAGIFGLALLGLSAIGGFAASRVWPDKIGARAV